MTYKIENLVYNNAVSILKRIESFRLTGGLLIHGVTALNEVLAPFEIYNMKKEVPWGKTPALVYYDAESEAVYAGAYVDIIVSGSVMLPTSNTATLINTVYPFVLYTRYLDCIDDGSYFDIKAVTLSLVSHLDIDGDVSAKIEYTTSSGVEGSYIVSDKVYAGRPNFLSLPVNLSLIKSCRVTITSTNSFILNRMLLHGNRIPV